MNAVSEGSQEQNGPVTEDMLKIFLEAFNRHDLDVIMTFFAKDCSFDFPRGPFPHGQRFVGKEAVREGLASRFKGIPDVHYGENRHFVSASGIAAFLNGYSRVPLRAVYELKSEDATSSSSA